MRNLNTAMRILLCVLLTCLSVTNKFVYAKNDERKSEFVAKMVDIRLACDLNDLGDREPSSSIIPVDAKVILTSGIEEQRLLQNSLRSLSQDKRPSPIIWYAIKKGMLERAFLKIVDKLPLGGGAAGDAAFAVFANEKINENRALTKAEENFVNVLANAVSVSLGAAIDRCESLFRGTDADPASYIRCIIIITGSKMVIDVSFMLAEDYVCGEDNKSCKNGFEWVKAFVDGAIRAYLTAGPEGGHVLQEGMEFLGAEIVLEDLLKDRKSNNNLNSTSINSRGLVL